MSGMLDIEPVSITNAPWLQVPDREPAMVAQPISLPVSLRNISPNSIEIAFPEFGGAFGGAVTIDSSEVDSGLVIATASITPDLDLVMELVDEDQTGSSTRATVEIRHRDAERRRAIDVFLRYTLFALLGLSRRVDLRLHIAGVEPLVSLSFAIPLSAVSQYLQSRHLAYKVMVIERATQEQFFLPATRSAVEVATISFVYEAIVKRSFLWPDNYDGGVIRLPASREGLSELLALKQEREVKCGPHPITSTLFGKTISLGVGTVTVLDAEIEDGDQSEAVLEGSEGREVQIGIRSLSGRIRYDLPEAPRLTEGLWDRNTQALIDIDSLLDAALFERYNALAAGSLAGLTDEEKARVTERVDFAAAFLPREMYGDETLWQRLLRFLRFR